MKAQQPNTQRQFSRGVSTSYVFAGSTDYTTPHTVIASIVGFQIVVQRILVIITGPNAAKNTFQATGSAPGATQVIATVPGSLAEAPFTYDFGEDGFVCSDGFPLQHVMSAAGSAGSVTIEAYLRPTPDTAIVANVAGTRGMTF